MQATPSYQPGTVYKKDSVIPVETGMILCKQAVEALQDVRVHNAARRIVSSVYDENHIQKDRIKEGAQLARLAEVWAVYNEVRKRIRYTKDPFQVELVYHPSELYKENGPFSFEDGNGKWAEDCDTIALLTVTLLLSLGHQARITLVGFPTVPGFSHVFTETHINGIGWVVVDPSLGPKVPGMVKEIVRFQNFYPVKQ